MPGSGFGVEFWVRGLGFRGLGFRVSGIEFGFGVLGFGFGFRFGFEFGGLGFWSFGVLRVLGLGFKVF